MLYLYAVQMIIYGYPFAPIKIGMSRDPQARSKFYCSGPFPVVWLGSWEVEDEFTSEREVHYRFANFRLVGEWFYPAKGLVRFVEQKIGVPIEAMLWRQPDRLKTEFQHRFVSLFPDGLSSVEKEWFEPGKAKPCSKRKFLEAQSVLNVMDLANPITLAIAARKATSGDG